MNQNFNFYTFNNKFHYVKQRVTCSFSPNFSQRRKCLILFFINPTFKMNIKLCCQTLGSKFLLFFRLKSQGWLFETSKSGGKVAGMFSRDGIQRQIWQFTQDFGCPQVEIRSQRSRVPDPGQVVVISPRSTDFTRRNCLPFGYNSVNIISFYLIIFKLRLKS